MRNPTERLRDINEVWKTVERDLPVLKRQVETLIGSLQPRDNSE